MRRELLEELALADIAIVGIVGAYHSRREAKDDYIVVYACRCDRPGRLQIADPAEIAEAGWYALDDLPPDLSPATARRIGEYRAAAGEMGAGAGRW